MPWVTRDEPREGPPPSQAARLAVEVQVEQALACLTQSMNLSKTERWQAVQHLAAARKMLAEEEQFNDSL